MGNDVDHEVLVKSFFFFFFYYLRSLELISSFCITLKASCLTAVYSSWENNRKSFSLRGLTYKKIVNECSSLNWLDTATSLSKTNFWFFWGSFALSGGRKRAHSQSGEERDDNGHLAKRTYPFTR